LIASAWADPAVLPPLFRADVGLEYRGSTRWGRLSEATGIVGLEKSSEHRIHFDGTFTAYRGLAASVGVELAPNAHTEWYDLPKMSFDPVARTGTYALGEPSPVDWHYGGWDGIWLGAAVSPYELAGTTVPLHLRIDVSFRTPGGRTRSQENSDRRGFSAGGVAGELRAAFSVQRGFARPYFVGTGRLEGRKTVDGQKVGAASFITGETGSEWTLWRGVTDQHFQIEVEAGVGVYGASSGVSGDSLPHSLEWLQGTSTAEAAHVRAKASFALDAQFHKYAGMTFGVEGEYRGPHAVDQLYPVLREEGVVTGFVRAYGRVR